MGSMSGGSGGGGGGGGGSGMGGILGLVSDLILPYKGPPKTPPGQPTQPHQMQPHPVAPLMGAQQTQLPAMQYLQRLGGLGLY